MASAISEMKLETQQIIKLLTAMEDDSVLSYADIKNAVGVDVQNGHRGLLRTAIKHAERETQRLFGTVFKVGVKRLVPGHSAGELIKSREHMRRTARKAFNRSANIEFDKLTKDERTQVNCERTVLHFVAEVSSDSKTKKLSKTVESTGDAMSFAKTLEHFQ